MPNYLSPGVYVEEIPPGSRPIEGVGTAIAAFVGLAGSGPFNTPTLVSNWSQFTKTFGEFRPGTYLAHAVYGYFLNGGGNCYIVRIGQDGSADSDGNSTRPRELPAAPQAQLGRMRIVALDPVSPPGEITVEVADPGGDEPTGDMFKLLIRRGGQVVEEYDRATLARGRQNVATMVNAASKLVRIEDAQPGTGVTGRPATGTSVPLTAPPGPSATPAPQLTAEDYVGDASERTGFCGLEAVEEVTMVAVPDLMSAYHAGALDLETVKAVHLAHIAHCELMGRMAIIDPPHGMNAQQVKDWRVVHAGYDSKDAVLYWPWIKVFDPATASNVFVPPSGHLAGVWARSDTSRGVHKAPANEVIRGALAVETAITRTEQELLNPNGINAIRSFPGRGVRVYGARTLSSESHWRYLNVRRFYQFLSASILLGTQWVVFEPNDDALHARIRRSVAAFLVNQWRGGALFGRSPEEAFYVKCDRETNPPESIDAGQVVCEVGYAPVKPAEFVIFRLAQLPSGTSVVS
jgi:uncharacterized protein